MTGAVLTTSRRTGSSPLPLKCWRHALSGGQKTLPRLPLEGLLRAPREPDGGGSPSREHHVLLLEHVLFRLRVSGRRNLDHVGVERLLPAPKPEKCARDALSGPAPKRQLATKVGDDESAQDRNPFVRSPLLVERRLPLQPRVPPVPAAPASLISVVPCRFESPDAAPARPRAPRGRIASPPATPGRRPAMPGPHRTRGTGSLRPLPAQHFPGDLRRVPHLRGARAGGGLRVAPLHRGNDAAVVSHPRARVGLAPAAGGGCPQVVHARPQRADERSGNDVPAPLEEQAVESVEPVRHRVRVAFRARLRSCPPRRRRAPRRARRSHA